MKRLSTAILAIGIALVFVLYMVTYTVGYNEIAIVTTFENAAEPDPELLAEGKDTGSVMQEPGLKWKWPWPIQQVRTYPTQLQVLEDTAEQLRLADGNTIIVNLSLTWRIQDPRAFAINLGTLEAADATLLSYMRDLRSEISNSYGFEDLVNEDPSRVKLDEVEDRIANKLSQLLARASTDYGIAVAEVTLGKMLYAESTAASVNQAMTQTQQTKAQEIRNQGTSQATAIISEAGSISEQLKNFADTVATQIEIVGINESNNYLARYSELGANEDLAIYLRQLEAIEQILANRTTFVLDARTFSPLDVLVYGHGGPGNLSRLFGEDEADEADDTEPTSLPAAPLHGEAQAEVLRQRIQTLESRIVELNRQLEQIDNAPSPLRSAVDRPLTPQTEARP